MNCQKCKKLLPHYIGRELPERDLKAIGMHVLDCWECRAELEEYERARRALAECGRQPLSAPAMGAMQRGIRQKVRLHALPESPNSSGRNESYSWSFGIAAAAGLAIVVGVYLVAGQSTYRTGTNANLAGNHAPLDGSNLIEVGRGHAASTLRPSLVLETPPPIRPVFSSVSNSSATSSLANSDSGAEETVFSFEPVSPSFKNFTLPETGAKLRKEEEASNGKEADGAAARNRPPLRASLVDF